MHSQLPLLALGEENKLKTLNKKRSVPNRKQQIGGQAACYSAPSDNSTTWYDWNWYWYGGGFIVAVLVVVLLTFELVVYATSPVMPTAALCSVDFINTDPASKRFHAKLGNMYSSKTSTCAVVGSAGFLRLQRLGTEIDSHDIVIRANLAPVGGYEPIVGSRTSFRVVNSEAIGAIFHEKVCGNHNNSEARKSVCPSYPLYLNSGDGWMVRKYKQMCPQTIILDHFDMDVWDPALHAQWQGWGTNLMSGAYALAIGLKLCPNGTTVYGVSHKGTFSLNNNESATYHYYDSKKQSKYDSLSSSAKALTRFAETQSMCLNLKSEGILYPNYNVPFESSKRVTDSLVDDIDHDLNRKVYMEHCL